MRSLRSHAGHNQLYSLQKRIQHTAIEYIPSGILKVRRINSIFRGVTNESDYVVVFDQILYKMFAHLSVGAKHEHFFPLPLHTSIDNGIDTDLTSDIISFQLTFISSFELQGVKISVFSLPIVF